MIHRVMNFFIYASLTCLMISCSALGLSVKFVTKETVSPPPENPLKDEQYGIEAGTLYYRLQFKEAVALVAAPEEAGITLAVNDSPTTNVGFIVDPWVPSDVLFELPDTLQVDDSVDIKVAGRTFKDSFGAIIEEDISVDTITVAANTSPPELFLHPVSLSPDRRNYYNILIILTEEINNSNFPTSKINFDMGNGTSSSADAVGSGPTTGSLTIAFSANLTEGQSVTFTIEADSFRDTNGTPNEELQFRIAILPNSPTISFGSP